MKIGSPTPASEATDRALQRLDAVLDAQPRAVQRVLRKGLRKGVDHRKLWWAKGKLGVSIPPELRVLYAWHNGQSAEGGLFDRVFSAECEVPLLMSGASARGIFMKLTEMVTTGVHVAGYFDAARYREVIGGNVYDDYLSYVRDGCDAHPTNLLPFGWMPLGERHGDDQDEDQVLDDDLVIALDDARGAVVLYEPAHEGFEDIIELAPSLASFLEGIATSLEEGTLALPPPPPPPQPKQKVDAAGLLVQELRARGMIELAANVQAADVATAVRPLLRIDGHEHAVAAVVAWLLADERIDEVFAEPEHVAVLVGEYVDAAPARRRR